MKFAVIGDAFVDLYQIGTIRGMSAEAPIPIVDVDETISLPGGAGNVAANLTAFGAQVFYLERAQQNYPIKNRLVTKDGQQLARWDREDWCRPYEKADLLGLLEADAVIVSDYGKGSISEEVIQLLRQVTLPVFVDTKGDPSPWLGSEAILFPNMEEYKRYGEKYNWFPRVVLKRGAAGISFLEFGSVILQRPAQAKFVRSVNGAGDTVIAAFALASLAGLSLPECLAFANAAAANVVEQPPQKRWTTVEEAIQRMEIQNEQTAEKRWQEIKPPASAVSRFGVYPGLAGMPGSEIGEADQNSDPDSSATGCAKSAREYNRAADTSTLPSVEQIVMDFFNQWDPQ